MREKAWGISELGIYKKRFKTEKERSESLGEVVGRERREVTEKTKKN